MADRPITTPLVADLPEDWAYGQTVAPTGAEVGLSEQHGYNYLMQKVNQVVEGVNTLNAGFDEVPTMDQLGGYVEMEQTIPPAERRANTLYGMILQNYGGDN